MHNIEGTVALKKSGTFYTFLHFSSIDIISILNTSIPKMSIL